MNKTCRSKIIRQFSHPSKEDVRWKTVDVRRLLCSNSPCPLSLEYSAIYSQSKGVKFTTELRFAYINNRGWCLFRSTSTSRHLRKGYDPTKMSNKSWSEKRIAELEIMPTLVMSIYTAGLFGKLYIWRLSWKESVERTLLKRDYSGSWGGKKTEIHVGGGHQKDCPRFENLDSLITRTPGKDFLKATNNHVTKSE